MKRANTLNKGLQRRKFKKDICINFFISISVLQYWYEIARTAGQNKISCTFVNGKLCTAYYAEGLASSEKNDLRLVASGIKAEHVNGKVENLQVAVNSIQQIIWDCKDLARREANRQDKTKLQKIEEQEVLQLNWFFEACGKEAILMYGED